MEAEYVAFLAIRPSDDGSSDGAVELKVFGSDGNLKEIITDFKRHGSPLNHNGLDPELRPSCYNYYPVSGIPPGTRFVTDYPSYMAWEIKASDDETIGSGRGSWVWAQVDSTLLRVEEIGGTGSNRATYKVCDLFWFFCCSAVFLVFLVFLVFMVFPGIPGNLKASTKQHDRVLISLPLHAFLLIVFYCTTMLHLFSRRYVSCPMTKTASWAIWANPRKMCMFR
jgi:hypothetical protein